ncbi:MAG TPA: MATE family efflux transporter [Phycisphaerales bacterium]|nr:MATE family efflux transporter [Phycisphaerales bacterium]HMP38704.1 MATE family efflux transporter [Phycisphaerales bacterium]
MAPLPPDDETSRAEAAAPHRGAAGAARAGRRGGADETTASIAPRSDEPRDAGGAVAEVGPLDASDPPEALLAIEEASAAQDAAGTIRSGKLAGRSMWAAIWILALPVLLQQAMAALVGLVDKIFAGNLPGSIVVPALDAIGIGAYIGWFIGIAMAGLGIGAQAIIARAMGRGDLAEAGGALGQAMVLSVVWGALVGAAMWVTVEPLARYCRLDDAATRMCVEYIRILALSMPLCGVMMVGSMCLHGAGETTRPSMIAIGVNLANVIGSWLLSGVALRFGSTVIDHPLGIDPEVWGVRGIAAGTALSYSFGALATLTLLLRGVKDLRLERRALAPDAAMTRRVVRLGIPNFLEGVAMWGVNLFVMRFIGVAAAARGDGQVGEGLVGAHIIAVQWEALSFLPGFAMGTAAGALAGQYLGAGNPAMARRTITACTLIGMAIMGAMGVLFMTFGKALTRVISDDPIYLDTVPDLLLICGSVQVFFALSMVTRQGLRGVGDVHWTLLITVVSSYAVRLPLAWYLGVHLGLGLQGIWLGLCGEIVIRGIAFGARFLSSAWERARV